VSAPAPAQPMPAPVSEPSTPSLGPAERPEILVGAAFAGGLVLAYILRRIAS
jgi:hypothetical protein